MTDTLDTNSSRAVMVNLGPYIGAVLLGTCVSMAFWGAACIQTLYYFFHKYPGDGWRLKGLVLWTMGTDTAHKCLIMVSIYRGVVTGRATNPDSFETIFNEYTMTVFVMLLISVPIQLFFTWRLWRFRTAVRWVFVVILIPAIFGHFAVGIVVVKSFFNLHTKVTTEAEDRRLMNLVIANLSAEAGTDIILALGLCTTLWQTYLEVSLTNDRPAITSTSLIVKRLMLLSVNTGVLTAAFGIVAMAMLFRFPSTHLHLAMCFIRAPIYSNMLLANLNARPYIRDEADRIGVIEFNGAQTDDERSTTMFGGTGILTGSQEMSQGMTNLERRSVLRSRINDGASTGSSTIPV